jgi:hypothetical protein
MAVSSEILRIVYHRRDFEEGNGNGVMMPDDGREADAGGGDGEGDVQMAGYADKNSMELVGVPCVSEQEKG